MPPTSAHAIDPVHAEPVVLAEEAHNSVAPRTAEADLVGVGRAGADQYLDVDGLARDHTPEGLLVGASEGREDRAVADTPTQRERYREVEGSPGVLDADAPL